MISNDHTDVKLEGAIKEKKHHIQREQEPRLLQKREKNEPWGGGIREYKKFLKIYKPEEYFTRLARFL